MVIKILGGKKASIRYQLKNLTARILHGDPAVTQRLIDGSHFSQKYCGIVLSFEENIPAETESAILDDFRHLLRGGLEEDALDILAVGHADKTHPATKAMRRNRLGRAGCCRRLARRRQRTRGKSSSGASCTLRMSAATFSGSSSGDSLENGRRSEVALLMSDPPP